ncbi:MAG: DUF58 domain-containing protein [Sporolactobacillus sp.]
MNWSIDSISENVRSLILLTGLLILVIGLMTGRYALWSIAIFFLLLAYFSKKILLHKIHHLELDNSDKELRLIPGEDGEFTLSFINHSRQAFPTFQGYFTLDPLVTLAGEQEKAKEIKFEVSVPAHSSAKISFRVHADTRGVARIRSLHLSFSDPLHIVQAALSYDQMIKNRIIVYPRPEKVPQPERRQQQAIGFDPSPFSLFVDFSAPIGTRDYQRSDSFRHIHWKASAQLGKMQTKTFEKIAPVSWTFLLLTPPNHYHFQTSPDFEHRLSAAAWLMRCAYKQDIRYAIFSNTKPMGNLLFNGIEADQGIRQLKKGWSFLAFIQRWQMKTPIDQALTAIHQRIQPGSTIILIEDGEQSGSAHILKNLQREGHSIYRLRLSGETAQLDPDRMKKEGEG